MATEIEKIAPGYYTYKGVRIFKCKNSGFSFKYSTFTDNYFRSDSILPISLKEIANEIDLMLENRVVKNGCIVQDLRTKVSA